MKANDLKKVEDLLAKLKNIPHDGIYALFGQGLWTKKIEDRPDTPTDIILAIQQNDKSYEDGVEHIKILYAAYLHEELKKLGVEP